MMLIGGFEFFFDKHIYVEMGGACGTYGRGERGVQGVGGET
jgi:hypothetical protein